MHKGSCLYGAVRYEVDGEIKHIFTGSKASWYTINDGLPQSESGT